MGIELKPHGALDLHDLAAWRERLRADHRHRFVMNAVVAGGLTDFALDQDVIVETKGAFSTDLDTGGATNQKKSGRCWMFAGLNLLRERARRNLGLDDLELSESYLMFFDKLEKANAFYESIIATAAEKADSQVVMALTEDPAGDGGEWQLFANLVEKYGLVPQGAMPETFHSSASHGMNAVLKHKLRHDAAELRRLAGPSLEAARNRKAVMVEEVYRLLSVFLGTPPERFDFAYRDAKKDFHALRHLTPERFFHEHVRFDFGAWANLMNVPTADKPFGRTYAVAHAPRVEGGRPYPYLNVDIDTMRSLTLRQLESGEGAYFGCDVVQMIDSASGVLDDRLYDLSAVFGMDLEFRKEEHLGPLGRISGGHQMLFTGVDVTEAGVRRWKVENSWGTDVGDKGYFVMNDGWFGKYVYQVVVRKDLLSPELAEALEAPPVVLPPWDVVRFLSR